MSDEPQIDGMIPIMPPIEFQNKTYEMLTLREPTAGDELVGDQQFRMGTTLEHVHMREIVIIAKVANVPVPVVMKMKKSAVNQAWAYVNRFLQLGLATGDL